MNALQSNLFSGIHCRISLSVKVRIKVLDEDVCYERRNHRNNCCRQQMFEATAYRRLEVLGSENQAQVRWGNQVAEVR